MGRSLIANEFVCELTLATARVEFLCRNMQSHGVPNPLIARGIYAPPSTRRASSRRYGLRALRAAWLYFAPNKSGTASPDSIAQR